MSAGKPCSVDAIMDVMSVDKNAGAWKTVVLLAAIGRTHEAKANVVADEAIRVVLAPTIEVFSSMPNQLKATCVPPRSKSMSNRALILAALGSGTCRIRNLLL